VGDWDIRQHILQADGSWREFPAVTSVRRALDGCALVEHWRGEVLFFWNGMREPAPMKGLSVRSYDPASGTWSIYWMDSLSPGFGTPYTGTIEDGHGLFQREWDTPQGRRAGRITFEAVGKDAVNWSLAISSDGGRSWSDVWNMAMHRRSADT
jgi:hypothetical protein